MIVVSFDFLIHFVFGGWRDRLFFDELNVVQRMKMLRLNSHCMIIIIVVIIDLDNYMVVDADFDFDDVVMTGEYLIECRCRWDGGR